MVLIFKNNGEFKLKNYKNIIKTLTLIILRKTIKKVFIRKEKMKLFSGMYKTLNSIYSGL